MKSQLNPTEQRLAWIRQWQVAAPMLQTQARNELRSLTLADRQKQINALLDLAQRMRIPRIDNGLVEWNRRLTIRLGAEWKESDAS
jgi:hypothetical protein